MSKFLRVSRLATLAAGGLLLGSIGGGGVANAACIGPKAGGTACTSTGATPAATTVPVASELFGTSIMTYYPGPTVPANNGQIAISSQFGGFGTDDQLLRRASALAAAFETTTTA